MELLNSAFSMMNPLFFGQGVSSMAGAKFKEMGCKKVLAVYDQGVKAAGIVEQVLKSVYAEGIAVVAYDNVQPDPPDWSVEEAGRLGLEEKIDGIIAIGGGSSLDTAKGAKLLQSNPFPLGQHLGFADVPPQIPNNVFLIVVPTTAGTGSEATPGGVITDTKRGLKLASGGPGWAVGFALVDPDLTMGLPPGVTAATGVDALCHAVESYTSIRTNPYTELFAWEAIRLIGKYLVRVYQNGSDAEAREKMMLAASYAGVSMMGPMGHFGHGIGTPLGHAFHIPHGIACGITTPQSLEYVAQAMPERIAATAECFGATVPAGATAKEIGRIMKETLIDVFRQINFPLLSSYGMTKQEASDIAVLALPQIWNSPLPVTEEAVRGMLEGAYDLQY